MTTHGARQLVGKFFHTFNDAGEVIWQGHVTGVIEPDLLIAELFSWVAGEPTDEIIVRLADLVTTPINGWARFAIYSNAEGMNRMYEARLRYRKRDAAVPSSDAAGKNGA